MRQNWHETRKGLLTPDHGARPFSLSRVSAPDDLADIIENFWLPVWDLPNGETIEQRIIQYPALNLVIEPTESALHGVVTGLSTRRLQGSGWAVGVLLRPGAAPGLLSALGRPGLPPAEVSTGAVALNTKHGLELTRAVRKAYPDLDRCVALMNDWLRNRAELHNEEVRRDRRRVNHVVDWARNDRSITRVEMLAERDGCSTRSLQRLLLSHIGVSPKWVISRFRLQEAAHQLRTDSSVHLADLALTVGYADQSHFTRDFAAVIGETPQHYRTSQQRAGMASHFAETQHTD